MTADKKTRIAVAIPAYGGQVDAGHCGTWLSFGHALAASDELYELVSWSIFDCNPVADARNLALKGAIDAGADWLLMLDADTYHEGPEDDVPTGGYDLLEMIASGRRAAELNEKVAAVFAPVHSRRDGHEYMAWRKAHTGDWLEAVLSNGLSPVDRAATACFAINVDWVRREWPGTAPGLPWFVHRALPGIVTAQGEDVFFCEGVLQRGGLIYLDGRLRPKHVMRAERL